MMAATRPVALVTGASSGIGKAAALALATAGFEVAGTSRKTPGLTHRDGTTFIGLDGIRVLLVEPGYTKTGFDANAMRPDTPLPVYAQQRHTFDDVLAAAMKNGDDPAIVAKVIVAAATDPKPKLRYTAGRAAGRVSTLRRIVPPRAFDRQIRKLNRLAG
jgi:NAD(P)-dependent dehydrogenase (short-subunit alcohol dehydrogenase family)